MPAKRKLTMRQLRQMLRLAGDGTSARDIALTLGVARSTVQDNLKRATTAGQETGTLLLAMRSLSTLAATKWIRIPIAYTLIDARANSRSRNSRRRILPVMVIGSSERYSTARGYL